MVLSFMLAHPFVPLTAGKCGGYFGRLSLSLWDKSIRVGEERVDRNGKIGLEF